MPKILSLLLISLLIPLASAQTTDQMLTELNTSTNVLILTYYLNNPQQSAIPIPSALSSQSVVHFETDNQIYYFVKGRGVYQSCVNCNNKLPTYIINPNYIKFIYNNQPYMHEILIDGELSYFETFILSIKYGLFNP